MSDCRELQCGRNELFPGQSSLVVTWLAWSQDKGLNCNYVVAKRPDNLPTSERAVPVAIFSTEPAVARTFLRKWCGDVRAGQSRVTVPHKPYQTRTWNLTER